MKTVANENDTLEPLLKADAAGRLVGFSPLTVLRMAREKRLPCIAFPVGNTGKFTYRFRASDLRAYLSTLERGPSVNMQVELSDCA